MGGGEGTKFSWAQGRKNPKYGPVYLYSPPFVPILNHINPTHVLPSSFKINLNQTAVNIQVFQMIYLHPSQLKVISFS
jgi:hypothetical protein